MQIRLYSASSEINGLYLIVDSQQIQINYNIQYNSKVDSSPKNVNYIIELLTLMLFQTHKTFVHLGTQSKIFLLPCSVVKSTNRDTIWYWNLKNVHFLLIIVYMHSISLTVIGYNDHCFTPFTERLHRSTRERLKATSISGSVTVSGSLVYLQIDRTLGWSNDHCSQSYLLSHVNTMTNQCCLRICLTVHKC